MKKLTYVFTNGLTAELVVVFNRYDENILKEVYNERVLEEVLLPNGWDRYYTTEEALEQQKWEKDEEGYYTGVIDVYSITNRQHFYLYENCLVEEFLTEEKIDEYSNKGVTVVELDKFVL